MLEREEHTDVFMCGGDVCPKNAGGPHVWDGPERRTEDTSAATCSKCGLDALSWSMWNGP